MSDDSDSDDDLMDKFQTPKPGWEPKGTKKRGGRPKGSKNKAKKAIAVVIGVKKGRGRPKGSGKKKGKKGKGKMSTAERGAKFKENLIFTEKDGIVTFTYKPKQKCADKSVWEFVLLTKSPKAAFIDAWRAELPELEKKFTPLSTTIVPSRDPLLRVLEPEQTITAFTIGDGADDMKTSNKGTVEDEMKTQRTKFTPEKSLYHEAHKNPTQSATGLNIPSPDIAKFVEECINLNHLPDKTYEEIVSSPLLSLFISVPMGFLAKLWYYTNEKPRNQSFKAKHVTVADLFKVFLRWIEQGNCSSSFGQDFIVDDDEYQDIINRLVPNQHFAKATEDAKAKPKAKNNHV